MSNFTFDQDAKRAQMYLDHIIEMEDPAQVKRYLPRMQEYLIDCVKRMVSNKLAKEDINNLLEYFEEEKKDEDNDII